MATAGPAPRSELRTARTPSPSAVGALALGGVAAASTSFALALASDHVPQPGLQAALMAWITLPYILGGLVAWCRRPDSRLGPLIVAAGFASFFSNPRWGARGSPSPDRPALDPPP